MYSEGYDKTLMTNGREFYLANRRITQAYNTETGFVMEGVEGAERGGEEVEGVGNGAERVEKG